MKITDVQATVLRQPNIELIGDGSQDTVLIKIFTDEGIVGIGEVDSSPYVVKSIIEAPASHMVCMGLRDAIIGEDPFNIEKIWYKMYHLSYYYGRRSAAVHAMSGIDMALWDILGKALGQPVYRLLGGAFRDKIRAYCSILMPDNEDEIKRIVDTYMPRGFNGIKFGWGALGKDNANDVRLIRAAREALGDDPYLMIDMGMAWDTKNAIKMAKRLEEYDLLWIEEPLSPDNIEGYARLSNSTNTKISAGEEVGTLYEFKDLIFKGEIDIVQPDISRCGGITMARKIADMAQLAGLKLIPHAFKTGILMAASLHLIASIPNALYLEYCSQETILSKHLIKNHFEVDGQGYVYIPQNPGLGIELNQDLVEELAVC
jgi:L-alanine-DL-glutamate epimerase-like enolase superfamily enzyme